MLVRLKEDFKIEGNSRMYRKGGLLSVNECTVKGNYIVIRYLGLNNWVRDVVKSSVVEIIG
ncbi:hypothetical protein [Clostridium perfringens]|uniref:hypothetical protein n=1 Tax=Clostridium perfringens TaxID=1502 RepID=UPI00096A7CC1|nr:hypothetical protein [Clostridium perfringens]VTQ55154.1 Uncharacterised protein [Clostridium perfringens]